MRARYAGTLALVAGCFVPLGETPDRTVTAKSRKRCPWCSKMIEASETAVLTDDRRVENLVSGNHGHAQYSAARGAWHLWHPVCREARAAWIAAEPERRAAELAALRAELEESAQ